MSYQQAFDTAVRGVLTQGRRSFEFGRCRYRSGDGSRCAVGHLFPDQLINAFSWANGVSVSALPVGMQMHLSDLLGGEVIELGSRAMRFLEDLQRAHDMTPPNERTNAEYIEGFKVRAAVLAHDFSLNTDVFNEAYPEPTGVSNCYAGCVDSFSFVETPLALALPGHSTFEQPSIGKVVQRDGEKKVLGYFSSSMVDGLGAAYLGRLKALVDSQVVEAPVEVEVLH